MLNVSKLFSSSKNWDINIALDLKKLGIGHLTQKIVVSAANV